MPPHDEEGGAEGSMAEDAFAGSAGGWPMNGEVEGAHMGNGDGLAAAPPPAPPLVVAIAAESGNDRDAAEGEDFFDPQDLVSTPRNGEVGGGNGTEQSWRPPETPVGEYYDAFEEISSEGTGQSSSRCIENELHEMRLNLLMEIEKRKQAEEALGNLQDSWQRMSHQLSFVGLMLPSAGIITEDKDKASLDVDPVEELGQQLLISQLVVEAVGRGCSRAKVELEMEPQINAKSFEIARLWDRLQYYEAANREMSQRNQEAVEMARQQRNRRKRRQKWIWRSVGLAVVLGAAATIWSYLPSSSSSSSEGVTEDVSELG